jgi:hypothetical protein
MRPVEKPPASIRRYRQIGGVLDFAFFEEAGGAGDEILAAVPHALRGHRVYRAEKLRELGGRRIRERAFFGEWYDPESAAVLRLGHHVGGGRIFENPKLRDLDGVKILNSSMPVPEPGEGGGFAYAFSHPPYGLDARPAEVQDLFDSLVHFILPDRMEHTILDWTSPRLREVSDYFEAGMEWWGVFLFSIHVPAIRRLTIIAGSTTD